MINVAIVLSTVLSQSASVYSTGELIGTYKLAKEQNRTKTDNGIMTLFFFFEMDACLLGSEFSVGSCLFVVTQNTRAPTYVFTVDAALEGHLYLYGWFWYTIVLGTLEAEDLHWKLTAELEADLQRHALRVSTREPEAVTGWSWGSQALHYLAVYQALNHASDQGTEYSQTVLFDGRYGLKL